MRDSANKKKTGKKATVKIVVRTDVALEIKYARGKQICVQQKR